MARLPSDGQVGKLSQIMDSFLRSHGGLCVWFNDGILPQDETLRVPLLQHHVVGPLRRGEDVRWQRRAQSTRGAQVQLTHLKDEEKPVGTFDRPLCHLDTRKPRQAARHHSLSLSLFFIQKTWMSCILSPLLTASCIYPGFWLYAKLMLDLPPKRNGVRGWSRH